MLYGWIIVLTHMDKWLDRGWTLAGQASIENRTALPLAEAAQRLGISVDALRKRWKRGKVSGYHNAEGRVFINLDTSGQEPGQMAGQASGQASMHADDGPDVKQLSEETQEAIIELQRVELNRLLAENRRLVDDASQLNGRVDDMLALQKREQVLRQQMQNQLEGLQERLALPTPETLRLESRLSETESNFDLLKQAMWKLVIFLESKQA